MGHQLRHPRVCMDDAVPFKIEGVYCKLLPLSGGLYAIVWESDYGWLIRWNWFGWWNPETRSSYAGRTEFLGNKKKRGILLHRLILSLEAGDPRLGDHKNGITLDNRRDNLRIADRKQNAANSRRSRNNRSGLKGAHWNPKSKKWDSKIQVDYLIILLGEFDTKEEAHAAYCIAAVKHFGEFARFN